MITRKMLMVAIVLIVLVAGTTMPSIADSQNGNNGQDKKAGNATNVSTDSQVQNLKNSITLPKLSHQPSNDIKSNNGSNGSRDLNPASLPGNGTSPSEVTGKLKIGNLPTPVGTIINKTMPAVVNKTPITDLRLKAEKNQDDLKIKVAVNQLNLYIKWVNNSRLPDTEKAILIAEANDNIDWYRHIASEIQGASSLQDARGIMADTENHSTALKTDLKKAAGVLASDNVDAKIATARNVSDMVEQRIATLKLGGNNTVKLDQLLSDYNAHVDAAAIHSEAARADFERITSVDDSDQLFNGGYHELQQAETELALAYKDLKEIYSILFHVS